MDPITAGINAIGNIFSSGNAKQAAKVTAKSNMYIADQMTEQERIRYDQALQSGNAALASQLLAQAQSRIDSKGTMNMLIIGGLVLMVIVVLVTKTLKK